jgi:hypothetical protein
MKKRIRRVRNWKMIKAFFGGSPCVKCGSIDYEYRIFYANFPGAICEDCEDKENLAKPFVRLPPRYYSR